MDIVALAASLTPVLVPFLPYLLKAGEAAADEAGKGIAGQGLELAKSLWSKLKPKVEAQPAALVAAQDAAATPDDADTQASFRKELKKVLTGDQTLAAEVQSMLEAAGVKVTASGDRSVAIGGNVSGSTIVTGDKNKVNR